MGELGDSQQSASLSEATAGDGLEALLTDPLRGLRPGHRCPLQCRLRRRIALRWQRRRGAGVEGFDAAGRAFLGGASMQQLQAALTMSVRPSSPKAMASCCNCAAKSRPIRACHTSVEPVEVVMRIRYVVQPVFAKCAVSDRPGLTRCCYSSREPVRHSRGHPLRERRALLGSRWWRRQMSGRQVTLGRDALPFADSGRA